jgi:hypothetical protein
MALAHCILGTFLGVGCHCFPPPLDVPTFSARCLHVQWRKRPLAAKGGTLRGQEIFRQILSRIQLPRNSRDLLHAANLRHGTDGFTSPPKEGVLRIFLPLKIRRLWPGLNPQIWVPKGSTLPLDHRSRPVVNIPTKIFRDGVNFILVVWYQRFWVLLFPSSGKITYLLNIPTPTHHESRFCYENHSTTKTETLIIYITA